MLFLGGSWTLGSAPEGSGELRAALFAWTYSKSFLGAKKLNETSPARAASWEQEIAAEQDFQKALAQLHEANRPHTLTTACRLPAMQRSWRKCNILAPVCTTNALEARGAGWCSLASSSTDLCWWGSNDVDFSRVPHNITWPPRHAVLVGEPAGGRVSSSPSSRGQLLNRPWDRATIHSRRCRKSTGISTRSSCTTGRQSIMWDFSCFNDHYSAGGKWRCGSTFVSMHWLSSYLQFLSWNSSEKPMVTFLQVQQRAGLRVRNLEDKNVRVIVFNL